MPDVPPASKSGRRKAAGSISALKGISFRRLAVGQLGPALYKLEGGFLMTKITVKVDGMMCGMCESHVNDAVRKAFPVKKVTSSHGKKETVILTEDDIDETMLKDAISATGYEVLSVQKEPYEKKGLFSVFKK